MPIASARSLTAAAALAAAVASTTAVAPARADDFGPAPAVMWRPPQRPDVWQGALGLRTAFVRDAGYDPFSTNDVLTALSGSVIRAFGSGPGLVPAVGLVGDIGESEAGARGVDSRLWLTRLSLALEARFVPVRGLYAMARLAPGWMRASAEMNDPSAPATLVGHQTGATLDASVGGGLRVTPPSSPVGFWVLADGGYGWAPTKDMVLRPSLPATDAQKAGATHLASLTTRGAFFRLAIALSY